MNHGRARSGHGLYLGTLHVVAALVLLDGGLAVGAGLGVGEHPQAVGGVLVGLAHPGHCNSRKDILKEPLLTTPLKQAVGFGGESFPPQ